MIADKTKPVCENCKYAKITATVKQPYLARVMDGEPDGKLMPWTVTVECEHAHVCVEMVDEDE